MKPRRRFGSIRKLPSGRFQARYLDKAGRSHGAPTTFSSRAAADCWLATVESDLSRGTWTDPRLARRTFDEQVVTWRRSKPDLRPGTVTLYAYLLRRLLLPYFGGVVLSDITPDLVRAWHGWAVAQTQRRGNSTKGAGGTGKATDRSLSRNTIAKAYRLLRSVLELAVEDEMILRNPCRLRGVASERAPKQRHASVQEVEAIAEAIDPRYRALVLLAAYTGLRYGEATGLRRRNLKIDGLTVRVVEQVTQPANGDFVVGPPKTSSGLREVHIPKALRPILTTHLATFSDPGPDGLVFPAPGGGFLSRTNFRRRYWLPAVETAGAVGLRFHDLRHTAGTLAAWAGVDTKTLMQSMDHSSPDAALRYQHARQDRAVADAMDAAISAAREQQEGAATSTRMARKHLRLIE